MAAIPKNSQKRAEQSEEANFGDTTLEEVKGVDVARVLAVWLTKVLKEIEETEQKDEDGVALPHDIYHLNFPTGLNSAQRKIVHQHAYTLKITSTSLSSGDSRYLRLTLGNCGKLSHTVLDLVQSDKLEEAINHRETRENSRVPKGMSLILDFLYLGSGKDAQDKDALNEAGISVVLNATAEWRVSHPNDFIHHRIELADNVKQSLDKALQDSCKIIYEAKNENPPRKVLVHCVMGRSRSASIIMAYLVKYENMSLKEAFELTHKARPIVRPNSRFLSDLIAWEQSHRGSSSLEVESWVEVVGVHGSQLKNGNWKQQNLPPPIELPADDARLVMRDAASGYLTDGVLQGLVANHCNHEYYSKHIPGFMNAVRQMFERDPTFLETLRQKGVLSADFIKYASLFAKDWYAAKIPKDEPKKERPKKKGKQSAPVAASSSASSE